MIPTYKLWLLSLTAAIMLLLLWSQLSALRNFSGQKYEHLLPKRTPKKGLNSPPIIAYWILGSKGEKQRILRLLRAIYHPRNQYLLHLDSSAGDYERVELAILTRSERVFREFGNVNVVGKSYTVNEMGGSGLAAAIHAAALLLRLSEDWDWFVPLSSSDYPLWTQDDILYAFSTLPKDLNFVGFINDTSWDKRQNINQIVVDPSLYLTEKTPIFYAVETRQKPDAFHIFGGSQWMMLSRGFLDHIVIGFDNLPRKLLMYFNNVVFPLESYFQTVLCNTPEFHNTTVNDDLRYVIQNTKTSINDTVGGLFAGPFKENDPQMQEIDEKVLSRGQYRVVPGKWCGKTGLKNETARINEDLCSVWGDIDVVEGGDRGITLRKSLLRIVEEKKSVSSLCESYFMQSETKR